MMTLQNVSRAAWIEQIMAIVGRAHPQPRRLRAALERLPLERLDAVRRRMFERLDAATDLTT